MAAPRGAVRERILESARVRYYADGIGPVSADRLIADAGVSKVTFYRHFPTKTALVVAYLEAEAASEAAVLAEKREHLADACAVLSWYAKRVAEVSCGPGFRGCPFVNARAELAEADHPGWTVIADHYTQLASQTQSLLEELGLSDARAKAEQLLLLRDGAMMTRNLGMSPDEVEKALVNAGRAVLDAAT